MRLEKNLYERLFNIDILGRGRKITKPTKFYMINPQYYMMAQAYHSAYHTSLWYKMFAPIMEKLFYYSTWTYRRDVELSRGYIPDDTEVHAEWDLRRGIFLEHVLRESCHPLYWLMYKYRRQRFFKIERTTQGLLVPDWIRKESAQRTLKEAAKMEAKFNDFAHKNFYSDMTPGSFYNRGKVNPFELLQIFGLTRFEGWERYFLNEQHYSIPEKEQWDEAFRKPWGCDLSTDDGRRQFEAKVNKKISQYPGMVVPEGQQYDFKHHYAV